MNVHNIVHQTIGKPAHRCRVCGCDRRWMNRSGGLTCPVCSPPSKLDKVVAWMILTAHDASSTTWRVDEFPDLPEQLIDRTDPEHPTTLVFISTRFHCREIQPSPAWGEWVYFNDELFGLLRREWLGWLYSRVLCLPNPQREESVAQLNSFVHRAVSAACLGAWANDKMNWPQAGSVNLPEDFSYAGSLFRQTGSLDGASSPVNDTIVNQPSCDCDGREISVGSIVETVQDVHVINGTVSPNGWRWRVVSSHHDVTGESRLRLKNVSGTDGTGISEIHPSRCRICNPQNPSLYTVRAIERSLVH